MTQWIIQRLADDALDILPPIFAHAFGAAIELSVLRWKYATGYGESWLAQTPAGTPVVHCGLLFRDVQFAGQRARIAQLVDLAAATGKQGLARRNGAFSCLMHHLLDRLPRADNPHGLALGFPSGRAMRLGEHLGVYRAVDQLYELQFTLTTKRSWLGLTCIPEDTLPSTGIIDQLWHDMARELAGTAVGRRDAQYLSWRFMRHPQNAYQLLACKSTFRRQTRALLVLRRSNDGICHVVDALAPPSVLPDALTALGTWCGQRQLRQIRFTLTGRFARQLQERLPNAECVALEIRIMANPNTPPEVLAYFQDNWWLTAGDTDYR